MSVVEIESVLEISDTRVISTESASQIIVSKAFVVMHPVMEEFAQIVPEEFASIPEQDSPTISVRVDRIVLREVSETVFAMVSRIVSEISGILVPVEESVPRDIASKDIVVTRPVRTVSVPRAIQEFVQIPLQICQIQSEYTFV